MTNVGAAISLRKPLGKKSSIKGEYRLEQVSIDSEVNQNDYIDKNFVGDNGDNSQLADDRIGEPRAVVVGQIVLVAPLRPHVAKHGAPGIGEILREKPRIRPELDDVGLEAARSV
jgi:hypothetical protein